MIAAGPMLRGIMSTVRYVLGGSDQVRRAYNNRNESIRGQLGVRL
jgi:hypothetical protein